MAFVRGMKNREYGAAHQEANCLYRNSLLLLRRRREEQVEVVERNLEDEKEE